MIKPIPDSEATLLTNGKPLEITESIYNDAKRIYKWCKECDGITEHLELPDYLKAPFKSVQICNAPKHTIKFQMGGNDDTTQSIAKIAVESRRRPARKQKRRTGTHNRVK